MFSRNTATGNLCRCKLGDAELQAKRVLPAVKVPTSAAAVQSR